MSPGFSISRNSLVPDHVLLSYRTHLIPVLWPFAFSFWVSKWACQNAPNHKWRPRFPGLLIRQINLSKFSCVNSTVYLNEALAIIRFPCPSYSGFQAFFLSELLISLLFWINRSIRSAVSCAVIRLLALVCSSSEVSSLVLR